MAARTAPALSRRARWAAATVNELRGSLCTLDDRSRRRRPRSIPCDVATKLERSAAVVLSAATARELHLLVEHTDGLWTRLGADSPESALVNGSFERLTYSAADAWRRRLASAALRSLSGCDSFAH